jgi:hypothetical protein
MVSISPTFYEQLFCTKVICEAFCARNLVLYFLAQENRRKRSFLNVGEIDNCVHHFFELPFSFF